MTARKTEFVMRSAPEFKKCAERTAWTPGWLSFKPLGEGGALYRKGQAHAAKFRLCACQGKASIRKYTTLEFRPFASRAFDSMRYPRRLSARARIKFNQCALQTMTPHSV